VDNQDSLTSLPIKRTWLADIVDTFLRRPNGEADIDAVLNHLMKKTKRELGREPEATVTRTINNYCENSGDLERQCTHPIFRRMGPGTYRLLGYPEVPDLLEIQGIEFSDSAYQRVWAFFCERAKSHPKWKGLTNREKLLAFSRNLESNEGLRELLRTYQKPVPDLFGSRDKDGESHA